MRVSAALFRLPTSLGLKFLLEPLHRVIELLSQFAPQFGDLGVLFPDLGAEAVPASRRSAWVDLQLLTDPTMLEAALCLPPMRAYREAAQR